MQIESIEIKNYRLFRHAKLTDIPPMCVLIGANGTGKTTLFDVLSFLKDALATNVAVAVARRGGYRELASYGFANEPIEIALTCRLQFADAEHCIVYRLVVASDSKGSVVVQHETLQSDADSKTELQDVFRFTNGKGHVVSGRADQALTDETPNTRVLELDSPDILALKGLGQFEQYRIASALRMMIESWHISDLDVSQARPSQQEGFADHLTMRGDNLALVANHLFEHHPERFEHVLKTMRERIPGVSSIEPKRTEDGRLVLRFQDGSFKDPFVARNVSDGTLKLFAYLVLLNEPTPHALLAIEEPENQLYPQLLLELAEEFRLYAHRGGQVMVTSHSPDFLNALNLDEIYCLRKQDGFTQVTKASESANLRALTEAGDLPGYLWKKGLFDELN